ncbi:MAG TPA: carboxylesterase family protein [Bryobacteraceae bacterium]
MSNTRSKTILALALIASAVPVVAALKQPVRTKSGLVEGITTGDVTAFKGILFAAPPVGDLRWRAPRPAARWSGVRQADRFSRDCFQAKTGAFGPWSAEYIAHDAMEGGSSEDCLYLNVWTAAAKADEKRPVIVWIHGGGFTSGSGGVPVYDGAGLASKGVVMVTINYRLGVFGFLAHPELTKESGHEASGNYGLADMIAALEWVRKNISAFGGDPAKVTIAGQSAGAFAVNYLMASPLAKGLFQRAIAESGGAFNGSLSLKEAEVAGEKLAAMHAARNIAELRGIPSDALLPKERGNRAGPIVDGYVVPREVYATFAEGRQNDVPLLTGWNQDDGVSFGEPPKADAFRAQAKRNYGGLADSFLKAFPADTDAEAARSQHALARDQLFAWQGRTWARLQAKTGKSKIFLYYFDHTAPGMPEQTKYGAFHSSEIPFALNTLAEWDRPWTATDRKIAEQMSAYWVNFAKNGDPNGPGLSRWPAYMREDERSLRLGEKIEPIPLPSAAELDFFDQYYARERVR